MSEADRVAAVAEQFGRIEVIPDEPVITLRNPLVGLQMLREPIPADQVEKLPKPLWKGAWDGERAARCSVCKGYHVLANAIHLDYCGHALTTNRLLDADPFWSWEPLALTDQGLPLFDKDGGLWIKLTVCGVTRLGYGDGSSRKEIIGDAIRNAAMRFGVALDLWSKADLHMDRNPGDGPTPRNQGRSSDRAGDKDDRDSARANGGQGGVPDPRRQADAARAENQDALDALQSVCNEHGYSVQYCIDRFNSDYDKHIRDGSVEEILLLAEQLADEATAEPDPPVGGGTESDDGAGPADDATEDTSDVEKKPGDMF